MAAMSIRQTTPPEAHETLKQHPDAVYLDVRTEEEFKAGHPAGARNVPILFLDPATREATLNPDFVTVVERNFPRTTKLIVGCQMGGRSQQACERLAVAGFVDLTNVRGGFGGARNALGRVSVPGWRDEGLPVELGTPPGAGYGDLRGGR
jgi:rhodanese-related sulfurtransferase